MDMEMAFFALFAVFAGIVVYLLSHGELVGEVEGSAGRNGVSATRNTLRILRSRGRSRHPRFRLVTVGGRGMEGRFYDRLRGRKLAELLEKAAAAALAGGPEGRQVVGTDGMAQVGLFRQRDGMGWVTVGWGDVCTCLGPGDALELAELLRIAGQHGATLEAAEQNWFREQERQESLAAQAAGGPAATS